MSEVNVESDSELNAIKTFAVIDAEGLVVNSIVWDGETEFEPGDGLSLVLPELSAYWGIGFRFVDGEWIAPEPDGEVDYAEFGTST